MKGKIIICGLSLILISGLSFSLLFSHKMATSKNPEVLVENEEIIAPAIIDSVSDIIRVPTLQGGIVTKIHVTVGQMVKKGQPLLSLDDTFGKHNLTANKIALKQAENNLIIQTKNLRRAKKQFERLNSIDKRAVSRSELQDRMHDVKMATIQLEQTQYNLDISKANFKNAETVLSQFTTVAPKDGIILQINVHVDEFVGGNHQAIYLGDAKKIIVRVSIDERDIKNFSSQASVYLTSNEDDKLKIPLTFMQLDRYIIAQERLNSRVQEALYFFNRDMYPNLAAGRQFDAHIAVKTI